MVILKNVKCAYNFILDSELKENMVFIDLHTDPLDWDENNLRTEKSRASWLSYVEMGPKTVVVIDNLYYASNILFSSQIAKYLNQLNKSKFVGDFS